MNILGLENCILCDTEAWLKAKETNPKARATDFPKLVVKDGVAYDVLGLKEKV